jgi:hypothetical protein
VSGRETAYEVVDEIAGRLLETLAQNEGMPIVARVEAEGACPAHDELASEPERWANEIRSAALDAGGGALWIEKVRLSTEPPQDRRSPEPASGPVAEMLRYLDEIQADPSRVRELAAVLDELEKKLPRELREGDEGVRLGDAQWLAGILGQVRPMLMRRLVGKGKTA